MFKKTSSSIFIFGNIIEIPRFNIINNTKITKSKIKMKKRIIYKNPNIKEKTTCIKISYFIGKFDPIKNLHLLFIKLIFIDKFFEDLRTTQQLGYLVEMYGSSIDNYYYIYQQIQSDKKSKILITQINEFNKKLLNIIKTIDLIKWKETITNHLNKKEENMNELFNKYYSEIILETFIFDKNKQMLEYIDKITKKSLMLFTQKYIIDNIKKNIIIIN
jgi:secreted Zn-dependent insulinase-like peptidase